MFTLSRGHKIAEMLPRTRSLHGRNTRREKAPQRGQFFYLLRRISGIRNDKSAGLTIRTAKGRLAEVQHTDVLPEIDRKNGPL